MAATDLGYRMVDADNHFYEGHDAFTRHLDQKYRRRVYWVTTEFGHQQIVIDGSVYRFIRNPTFDPVSVAGAHVDMYRNEKSRDQLEDDVLAGHKLVEPLADHPEYQQKDARIRRLDEQGLEACLLYPTLANGLEPYLHHDPELLYAVLRAFNEWMVEEWPFGYQDRLYSMPLISLVDVERAIELLELGLAHGARSVLINPSPVLCADGWRSPGDPRFDPFWARLADSGGYVAFHSTDVGDVDYAMRWQSSTDPVGTAAIESSSFQMVTQSFRPMSDTIAALIVHGTFERVPGLKALSVENGSGWVAPLLSTFRTHYQHDPARFAANPVDVFHEHVWISPFWEEDLTGLAESIPLERMLAGSDFPHPEGLPEPIEFVRGLKEFGADEQRRILRTNALELLGVADR
jgi:predicted TIM-barrel fold metal-dependent hydrolase